MSLAVITALSLGFSGCGAIQPQIVNSKISNGKQKSEIILHRESNMLGAALNMEVFLNGKKVNQDLYSDETINKIVQNNGTIILQVEEEVEKIENVQNNDIIKCSVKPVVGGAFLKNAFFINGLHPRLDVEINCIQ